MISIKDNGAKEYAKDLFDSFYYIIPSFPLPIDDHLAKECALIAIHKILQETANEEDEYEPFFILVREEILKL
jgi:hypothetical protein